jgi:hypothetical protein
VISSLGKNPIQTAIDFKINQNTGIPEDTDLVKKNEYS